MKIKFASLIISIFLILYSFLGCTFYNPWAENTFDPDLLAPPDVNITTPSPTLTPSPSPTPGSTLPSGKYPDYTYIRPIEITENSANALTDYQILITLSTGNFDYTHVIDANGNDIRFDYNNTECSYWIETWNTGGESKLWVKIPDLGISQTANLYMFYGYASAVQMSAGDNTFILFDDFNDNSFDVTKWLDISSYSASVTEENQRLTLQMDYPNQSRGFLRSLNQVTEKNISLHFKSQFESTDSSIISVLHFDGDHTSSYDYPSNGFNFDWMTNLNKFAMDSFVNTSNTRVVENPGYSPDLNLHDFQFRYYNQNIQVIYDDTIALDGNHSESFSTSYIGLAGRETYDSLSNNKTYIDDVFVRKYVSPEPSVFIGTEELNS